MTYIKRISALFWLVMLLVACGENKLAPTPGAAAQPTPIPTPRTSVTKTELIYPAAVWLSDKDIWPAGRPAGFQNRMFGAFTTGDSLQQVLDFYEKKVVSLGLGYEPNYTCLIEPQQCQNIYGIEANINECTPDHRACGDTYYVQFLFMNAKATREEGKKLSLPDTVYPLAQRGQTLVMFMDTPYRPFQPPPLTATTAAVVINTPMPKR